MAATNRDQEHHSSKRRSSCCLSIGHRCNLLCCVNASVYIPMRVQSFSAWIYAVNSLRFLVWQSGLGGFGMVFSKPLIAIEHKTFRIRPAANVDLDLYLSAAEDNSVIPY